MKRASAAAAHDGVDVDHNVVTRRVVRQSSVSPLRCQKLRNALGFVCQDACDVAVDILQAERRLI